jgi:hypothetical protein
MILAPAGWGKTTLGVALVRALHPPKESVIVVGPVPTLAKELGVKWYNVSTTDREEQERFFRRVLDDVRIPYDEGGRDYCLVIDEADLYFSTAGRTYGCDALREIVNTARNYGLCQILIARGTSDLAKNAIANSSAVFMGRVIEPNLQDYARRWMKDIPDVERVLGNLPPHVFVVYAPNQTPKLQGLAKVVNGVIECRELTLSPPQSPSITPNEERISPAESAGTEVADDVSPIDTGPDIAESITASMKPKDTASPSDAHTTESAPPSVKS